MTLLSSVKFLVEDFFSNFLAFSEYPNFTASESFQDFYGHGLKKQNYGVKYHFWCSSKIFGLVQNCPNRGRIGYQILVWTFLESKPEIFRKI